MSSEQNLTKLKRACLFRNGHMELASGDTVRWIDHHPGVGGLLEIKGPDSATACFLTRSEAQLLSDRLNQEVRHES